MAGKPGGRGADLDGHGADPGEQAADRDGGQAAGNFPGPGPDWGPAGGGGLLQQALAAGELAITAEIGPPRGASTAPVSRATAVLRDWVHAINITDNQGATARLAGWAAALAVIAAGAEPVLQLTCRDRNRIVLQSELLAASAAGIPAVLIMTGDHPRYGDHAEATPVFDLDSTQLLAVARAMRDQGRLMSGRELRPPPSWLIGAVTDGPGDPTAGRLAAKVAAGAEFAQTQYVFDVPGFARWMARVTDLGLAQRCRILAGVGPVLSPRALQHLSRLPGVAIPDEVTRRLELAGRRSPEAFRAAGEQLCAELITAIREIPGVAGLHVMAPGAPAAIPAVLRQAGLEPVRAPVGGPVRPLAGGTAPAPGGTAPAPGGVHPERGLARPGEAGAGDGAGAGGGAGHAS
ncbi:MAG TPA: methylenetetrahydrofolate reductase [Streptosporangiaceae bacterium]